MTNQRGNMKLGALICVLVIVPAGPGAAQVNKRQVGWADSAADAQSATDVYLANYIVAKVNEEIITRHDVEQALALQTRNFGSVPFGKGESGEAPAQHILSTFDSLAVGKTVSPDELERMSAILRPLVDQILLRQVARRQLGERHLNSVRAAVDRYLRRKHGIPGLANAGTRPGSADAEMDRRIFEALLSRNINVGRDVISPRAIRDFYDSHLDSFREPARVSFRHIMIRAERGVSLVQARTRLQGLRTQLVSGADFAQLAREHSGGPRARVGGLWQDIAPSILLPALGEQLAESAVGVTSDVFPTPQGYHIVQLLERRPGGPRSFSEVQAEIQDYLYLGFLDRAIDTWLHEEFHKAFVWTLLELQGVKLYQNTATLN